MRFRRISSLLSVAMVGFLSSCLNSSSDTVTPDKPLSGIAFLHAAPGSPNLNVILDLKTINTSSFNYSSFSGYLSGDPGTHALRFSSTTDQTAQLDTTITVVAKKSYTLFLYNKGVKMKSFVSLDEAVPFATTNGMMVRVVHLSPDLPEVKVVLVGESKILADQLDITEITPFSEYKIKESTVEVRAVSDDHVITTATFNPLAGQYFTIAIMGYATPPAGNPNTISVKVITN